MYMYVFVYAYASCIFFGAGISPAISFEPSVVAIHNMVGGRVGWGGMGCRGWGVGEWE